MKSVNSGGSEGWREEKGGGERRVDQVTYIHPIRSRVQIYSAFLPVCVYLCSVNTEIISAAHRVAGRVGCHEPRRWWGGTTPA